MDDFAPISQSVFKKVFKPKKQVNDENQNTKVTQPQGNKPLKKRKNSYNNENQQKPTRQIEDAFTLFYSEDADFQRKMQTQEKGISKLMKVFHPVAKKNEAAKNSDENESSLQEKTVDFSNALKPRNVFAEQNISKENVQIYQYDKENSLESNALKPRSFGKQFGENNTLSSVQFNTNTQVQPKKAFQQNSILGVDKENGLTKQVPLSENKVQIKNQAKKNPLVSQSTQVEQPNTQQQKKVDLVTVATQTDDLAQQETKESSTEGKDKKRKSKRRQRKNKNKKNKEKKEKKQKQKKIEKQEPSKEENKNVDTLPTKTEQKNKQSLSLGAASFKPGNTKNITPIEF